MVFDQTFATWRTFGVQANSQLLVLNADLDKGSNLLYGFDETKQAAILGLAESL